MFLYHWKISLTNSQDFSLLYIIFFETDLFAAKVKLQVKAVIPECSSHRLIIHVRFIFVFPPESGYSFWVDQLEDPSLWIGPLNVAWTHLPVLQQLHQELPQVQCVSSWVTQKTRTKNTFYISLHLDTASTYQFKWKRVAKTDLVYLCCVFIDMNE